MTSTRLYGIKEINMDRIEKKASSVELAIEEGLKEMGLTADQVDVEVVSQPGFLGLKKAHVILTKKPVVGVDAAKEFIDEVLRLLNFDCTTTLEKGEEQDVIRISGKDTGSVIGYRGDVLDSIQYLSHLVANKTKPLDKRLLIDAENYRDKRIMTLTSLAKKLAYKVRKTLKPVELEPMNPFERRIIHTTLQEDEYVVTTSVGEDPNRHLVISPSDKAKSVMYDHTKKNDFKKNGFKTRSFGAKRRRF